ncbi:MAG TPA: hypothetical protein VLI43_17090 [Gemmatimonadaceae bacterium]|nr:hypothetical protein [Gemmatimonadaceae bacterium]
MTRAASPKRPAKRKQGTVARVRRVATEVGTQAMDAGRTVVEEARVMVERAYDSTSDAINKVTS